MQVKCSCGKVLKVPDTAAGKRVKCPACGEVLQVPGEPSAPPAAQGASDKIIVECSCGKKLAAPASAAGKQVRCPACKAAISVPGGKEEARGSDDFSLEMESDDSDEPGEDEYDVAQPKCPVCGAILAPAAQFCVSCGTHISTGTRVDGVDMNAIEQKKTDNKKARYGILVIIVVAVLIIAGSVVFLLPDILAKVKTWRESGDAPATSSSSSTAGDAETPAPENPEN